MVPSSATTTTTILCASSRTISKIERWDQVEIYEDIMKDQAGQVTTGLLHAVGYLKDNRILPTGFDKQTAPRGDRRGWRRGHRRQLHRRRGSRAVFRLGRQCTGPFRIEAELCYQPVGFRWAHNLMRYNAMEPQRFVRYYDALSSSSAVVLARAEAKQ